MSFNWSEYLNLAKELNGQTTSPSTQEAKMRSAISRAYYAALCQARNHLQDKEGHSVPQGENVHQFVPEQFLLSSDIAHKQIGVDLDRLRKDRNKADYDDTVAGLPAVTVKALRTFERVISTLGSL